MKPAVSYHLSSPLQTWSQVPDGEQLQRQENEIIAAKLQLCFGHHLVKLGALACAFDCRDSLIEHQINLLNQPSGQSPAGVIADYDDLPLQTNSVDLVLLTHLLEYSSDPHQVLREAHRVLHPNGNVIISVFNPVSALFIGKLWPFKAKSQFWQFRLFAIARVKDWLNLLGFEITDVHYCGYGATNSATSELSWWGKIKKKFFPTLGLACVITARKREWPLTPIRPRVRYKTRFSPAFTPSNKLQADKSQS